jgi:hypothetical protein
MFQFTIAGFARRDTLYVANLVAEFRLSGKMMDETGAVYALPPSDRQDFDFVVQHLIVALTTNHKINCLGQDFISKASIVSYTTNANSRQLPQVIIFNLGYGDIEFVLQTGCNRLYYLSFTLERQIIRQAKFYFTYTDIHYSIIAE